MNEPPKLQYIKYTWEDNKGSTEDVTAKIKFLAESMLVLHNSETKYCVCTQCEVARKILK